MRQEYDEADTAYGRLRHNAGGCRRERDHLRFPAVWNPVGCLSASAGTAVDGHQFAEQAKKAGAAAIVCERDLGTGRPAAGAVHPRSLGAHVCKLVWQSRPRLHLVGITGTNGKTTTSYLLKSILEAAGHKVGLIGTIQNMIGERVLPAGATHARSL